MRLAQLKAAVAYDDFGPSDAFLPQTIWVVSGATSAYGSPVTEAMQFTSAASGSLSTIKIAQGFISGTNSFTVSLLADNANAPGATLESFSLTNAHQLPDNNVYAPEVLTSLSNPTLAAGTNYWVQVVPSDINSNTYGGWNQNSTGVTGLFSYNGTQYPNFTLGAFAVNVTVPEPATLSLLALGGLGLFAPPKPVAGIDEWFAARQISESKKERDIRTSRFIYSGCLDVPFFLSLF